MAEKIHPDYYRADFCYKKYSAQQVRDIMSRLKNVSGLKNTISANMERNADMF